MIRGERERDGARVRLSQVDPTRYFGLCPSLAYCCVQLLGAAGATTTRCLRPPPPSPLCSAQWPVRPEQRSDSRKLRRLCDDDDDDVDHGQVLCAQRRASELCACASMAKKAARSHSLYLRVAMLMMPPPVHPWLKRALLLLAFAFELRRSAKKLLAEPARLSNRKQTRRQR